MRGGGGPSLLLNGVEKNLQYHICFKGNGEDDNYEHERDIDINENIVAEDEYGAGGEDEMEIDPVMSCHQVY